MVFLGMCLLHIAVMVLVMLSHVVLACLDVFHSQLYIDQ